MNKRTRAVLDGADTTLQAVRRLQDQHDAAAAVAWLDETWAAAEAIAARGALPQVLTAEGDEAGWRLALLRQHLGPLRAPHPTGGPSASRRMFDLLDLDTGLPWQGPNGDGAAWPYPLPWWDIGPDLPTPTAQVWTVDRDGNLREGYPPEWDA